MQIGIVGGVERGWNTYERMAAACGHGVELHGGHIRGRGQETLESLVRRSDVLVVVTGINSHAAVQQARRLAQKHGLRVVLWKSFGTSRFGALLQALRGAAPGVGDDQCEQAQTAQRPLPSATLSFMSPG